MKSYAKGFRPISPAVLGALLFLLAVCTFLPTLENGFINFDDPLYVSENVHVVQGLTSAGLAWAFHGTTGGIWLPLTWISHMLDCQLYGLKPWGHHLTSVLIHATSMTLVFLWLFRMTGAKWRSFVVAALFGLHPLRVESVAWAAERKDVLSALFWFLTLWAYAEYVKKSQSETLRAKRFYALTIIFFSLGLMSKPMLVTLPFVLLLLDYWPLNRLQDRKDAKLLIVEKWPFFVLSVLASVIAYAAEKHEKVIVSLTHLPLSYRIENAVVSYVQYIGKLFWPENLCAFYPPPDHFSLGAVFTAVILLAIISVVFVWQWRRQPYLLVGWLWFLGTLIPVIGLVQLGEQAMADRYTYIPEIGLLLCVVWGVNALTKTWKQQSLVLSATATMTIIACMALTVRQIGWWRNSETLFEHAIAVTGKNAIAYLNVGIALAKNGQIDEAIINYQEALEIDPNNATAHYNLGTALVKVNRTAEAVIHFQKVLEINPDDAEACHDLGNALYQMGRMNEAIDCYKKVLELKPDNVPAYNNLATALCQLGRMDEAVGYFQKSLQIEPNAAVYGNLGLALSQLGRTAEAIICYKKGLAINPNDIEVQFNLGNALYEQGQIDEAILHYQKALEINPNHAGVYCNLGVALYKTGRVNEAIASAQQALQLAHEQNNTTLADTLQKQIEFYQTNVVVQPAHP